MIQNDAPIRVLDEFQVSGGYPPGRRAMCPSIEIASNGDLLVAYVECNDHHQTDGGAVMLSRSVDNGITWPEKTPIAAEPGRHCYTNHGMTKLSNGTLVLQIIRGKISDPNLPGDYLASRGSFIRSVDHGRAWSQYGSQIDFSGWAKDGRGFAYGKILQLSNGRLMVPAYGVPNNASDPRLRMSGVAFSNDQGVSWTSNTILYEDHVGDVNPSETDIIQCDDGSYLAMIRANAARMLYKSYSYDNGNNWTAIEPTELPGQCPALIKLSNGHILCAYRDMTPGENGMSCAVSTDMGKTWLILGHLYRGSNSDCAYPSMVSLPGGNIYCVFYTASYPEPATGVSEIRGLLIRDKTHSDTW